MSANKLTRPLFFRSTRIDFVHFLAMCCRMKSVHYFFMMFLVAPYSYATTISYTTTNLIGNSWQYRYSVTNDSLIDPINELTIYFDRNSFSNLSVVGSPIGWDSIVIQPDLAIPADGFFDGLTLVQGVAPGAKVGGFLVGFQYLKAGTPGSQSFEIIDPSNFDVIASGLTTAESVLPPPPSTVPEPSSIALMALGLAAWIVRRSRARYYSQLLILFLIPVSATAWAAPAVTQLTLVNEVRISRTAYNLTYQITVQNDSTVRAGVIATLTGAGQGTSIIDSSAVVGDLAANAVGSPADTITVRHDRTRPFDRSALVWQITSTTPTPVSWSGVREDGAPVPARDTAYAVATDADGNVVIAGKSDGVLPGGTNTSALLPDPFVAKYRKSGALQWLRSVLPARGALGTTDTAWGVATDSVGNIYVVGDTVDALPGEVQAGGRDAFIAKFDPDGNRLWTHLLGTLQGDTARAIAVDDDGNAFIAGSTGGGQLPLQPPTAGELFIAKFDTDGNRQWIHQWGSGGDGANRDSARGVAVDAAGNAYMTGYIPFNYAGTTPGGSGDAFAAKYDTFGNQVWFTRIRGLGPDEANAIAVAADGQTIYVTGRTNSNFDLPGFPAQTIFCCGRPDAFITRLDGNGALQWAHNLSSLAQGSTHFDDQAFGIATDANGSAAYIAGATNGVMPTETSKGAYDVFVARFESDGTINWIRQFGSSPPSNSSGTDNLWDHAFAITMDLNGDLFVVGDSIGTFGGTPGGDTDRTDWIVLKMDPSDGSLY